MKAYSSWRVDTLDGERHPVHLGISQATREGYLALDDLVERERLPRLDFVKIDTGGNDLAVLHGMTGCLAKLRPAVIFELSTYLLEENGESFDKYETIFRAADYELFRSTDRHPIGMENLDRMIPPRGGIDVLALPRRRT